MSVLNLTGHRIRIGVGDTFETSPLFNPFDREMYATVTLALLDGSIAALDLNVPLSVGASVFSHAVVSPRHEDRSLQELLKGEDILCAVTLVPDERFSSEKPFDLSWWRGGNAAIASLKLA